MAGLAKRGIYIGVFKKAWMYFSTWLTESGVVALSNVAMRFLPRTYPLAA